MKQITIPLEEYVSVLIGSGEKAPVSTERAAEIACIDTDESICHVQFMDMITGSVLREPLVWFIRDWKSSYSKYELDKELSKRRQANWEAMKRNIRRLSKAMAAKTTCDADMFTEAATALVHKKQVGLFESFGIKWEEFES